MAFQPIRATPPQNASLVVDGGKDGLITLLDESRLPATAAKESINLMQTQDGRWTTRWGTATYGATHTATLDGAFEYRKSDGTTEMITIAGGVVSRSTNGGALTTITGSSLTAGVQVRGKQIASRLYLANGTDPLQYYDGTSIQTYSFLAAPAAPTVTAVAALTSGTKPYNVYYQIVAVNAVGATTPSTATSANINKIRSQWTAASEYIDISWSAVASATGYQVFYSEDNSVYGLLAVVSGTAYHDNGTDTVNPYTIPPTDNTTTGPKFSQMELSGNRIWGTKDPANPYRVYGGGVGTSQGAFSSFYGGFWIDLEKGGVEYPTAVVHYRDGKGEGQATVFTTNPAGFGSIWQVALSEVTVGTETFIIPQATKITGTTGTNAPDSVVKVGDAVFFCNKKGMYSLGSKPSLLNVLSTAELSANIRPTWRSLRSSAMSGVACYFYDAKVFVSVPYGSNYNDRTYIFDTERRNWSGPWTVGFKQYLEYTDTTGTTHFLGVAGTGTKLIEISENFLGDQGVAFSTSYVSGLYPVAKNRLDWVKERDVYVDFNQPRGTISIEALGTEKTKGFSSLTSTTITDQVSNSGFGTEGLGTTQFGASSHGPTAYAQATKRRRVAIRRLLNNLQLRVTTATLNTKYTLMGWQTKGYVIPTRDPASWSN